MSNIITLNRQNKKKRIFRNCLDKYEKLESIKETPTSGGSQSILMLEDAETHAFALKIIVSIYYSMLLLIQIYINHHFYGLLLKIGIY